MSESDRTSPRILIIGSNSVPEHDHVGWENATKPNIPDYDTVVVSVPHMSEEFLESVDSDSMVQLRKAFIQLIHSGGNIIALVNAIFEGRNEQRFPEVITINSWSPIQYNTVLESGKSIIVRQDLFASYLKRMSDWSYYLHVPRDCLTNELTDFYGSTSRTRYRMPFHPFVENRYNRPLAGLFRVFVTRERHSTDDFGHSYTEYPEKPDEVTGKITLLPLVNGVSAEEALA